MIEEIFSDMISTLCIIIYFIFLHFINCISVDFQEKIGEDKNKNSSHDFKTLADVLIQESIRYDMGKEFPELKDSIQAKLYIPSTLNS